MVTTGGIAFIRAVKVEVRILRSALDTSLGVFDSGCKGEDIFKPRDVKHGEDARSDAGKSELDTLVAAVNLVIDDFTHAGRIHEGHATEIEDGVRWWLCPAKKSAQRNNAVQGQRA